MKIRNRVIAACFFLIILFSLVSVRYYTSLWSGMKDLIETRRNGQGQAAGALLEEVKALSARILEAEPFQTVFVEWNGRALQAAGVRSYYDMEYGVNITEDRCVIGRYPWTSTDYEVREMIAFKEYLDGKGIGLLYVNEPIKYIEDEFYRQRFGDRTYSNDNADRFLERISEAGIDCLDLRDNIRQENLDPASLFYRTDHHWTVPASEWAAATIAERLNRDFGYHIDMSLYDRKAFDTTLYEDCWLGEQGRLVSKSYVGLDDYTVMQPKYETSYQILSPDGSVMREGTFEVFMDRTFLEMEGSCYNTPSLHYSYTAFPFCTLRNNRAGYGNILVLGDSFEQSMVPFLTLGVEDLVFVSMRDYTYGSIRDYIEAGNFDTVIIAYVQFMLGAHDNEDNANYNIFALD